MKYPPEWIGFRSVIDGSLVELVSVLPGSDKYRFRPVGATDSLQLGLAFLEPLTPEAEEWRAFWIERTLARLREVNFK